MEVCAPTKRTKTQSLSSKTAGGVFAEYGEEDGDEPDSETRGDEFKWRGEVGDFPEKRGQEG